MYVLNGDMICCCVDGFGDFLLLIQMGVIYYVCLINSVDDEW